MNKREFTAEYKAKIVLEILKEEKKVSEIASREEINRTQLQNWKKEFKDVLIIVASVKYFLALISFLWSIVFTTE